MGDSLFGLVGWLICWLFGWYGLDALVGCFNLFCSFGWLFWLLTLAGLLFCCLFSLVALVVFGGLIIFIIFFGW